MEGVPILITDFNEGVCFTLLELLSEKNALPFVLVKDFETIHEIYANFSSAIPVVLNAQQSVESTIDHISVLPTMSCIFNFEGEEFEDLHRQTFDHFIRSINIYKEDFDISEVNKDILEAISDGYTLIVNLVNFPLPTATNQLLAKVEEVETDPPPPPNNNLKYIFEKVFQKSGPKPKCPAQAKEKAAAASRKYPCRHMPNNRGINPISILLKKIFTRFNPCSGMPALNLMSRRSRNYAIKSPDEINKYITTQQSAEIRSAFETIHESALRNWIRNCKENFSFALAYEEQFQRLCEDIHRKGEEGRKVLLDKVYKDIERTRQWDHVLGEKTVDRLKLSREREADLKVQQFCNRKIAEAREKIDEDIRQNKLRTKGIFYCEILDEQVMELMRIKEKFEKRSELLMLPYTGELRIFTK